MAKLRRSGSRNWARGFFAFFSILLAGASGLYLFTLMTDPGAFGSQTAYVNSLAPDTAAQPAAPAATAPLPSAVSKPDPGLEKKLAELSAGVAALTRQVASLDTRLKPIEKFVGPVAALPPATSVTTSPPELPAEFTDPAPPPQPEPQAEVAPAAPQEAAPEPQPEPGPSAPVADEPAPQPEPMTDPAPAAEEPMQPEPMEQAAAPAEATPEPAQEPAALAAPLDAAPSEADAGSASEAPAPQEPETVPSTAPAAEPVESAALDPVALPPTANDGTTRYGIELGIVAKQDGLRPLWREFLTNHAALVAGLQPRRVLAPDKKWRLIAGPFSNAEEAAQACALFKKVSRPCEATVYAGDRL
jgi:hypothetical protein